MIRTRLRWAAALGVLLASHAAGLRSEAQPIAVSAARVPSGAVTIGAPIAVSAPAVQISSAETLLPVPPPPIINTEPGTLLPVTFETPAITVPGQAPDGMYAGSMSFYQPPSPPPPPPPPGAGGPPPYPPPLDPGPPLDRPLTQPNSWGWLKGSDGQGFNCRSDCAFESLITPISNPFFFEDPRSLSEIRPLFLFQTSPSGNPVFNGGNSYFYGIQGRLALNDRWSVVVNKLGFITFNPKNATPDFEGGTGFAEFNIGPKWTFLHNTQTNTVAALGVNADLPFGSKKIGQDTGSLSLDPYFTIAQSFGRSSWGSCNVVSTTGYNFGVDNARSDFFHTALHLDYDILAAHKYYPTLELNWFHYTTAGKSRPLTFEGVDLGNFGSTGVSGHDDLSLAVGYRHKFSPHFSAGIAAEFPLVTMKDIQNFRLTLDVIYRW